LLFALTLEPPQGLAAEVGRRLNDIIPFSLRVPRHFAASIDKTLRRRRPKRPASGSWHRL
jgi:hypothetical protein